MLEQGTICRSCDANSGLKKISPGRSLLKGSHWNVEHAFPTSLLGWTVIVLNRHCEELHNLTRSEWAELAEIQYLVTKTMNQYSLVEKEYVACFAEKEGFKHIHFHVIPKSSTLRPESSGVNVFAHLNPKEQEILTSDEVARYCDRMNTLLQANWKLEAETTSKLAFL